ncbi:hypothetical protein HDU96_008885 [Phlyctochytrium bullatum]|nr:hypothetical protein HDU96_008885 [Phlyctochytrium bullatum]
MLDPPSNDGASSSNAEAFNPEMESAWQALDLLNVEKRRLADMESSISDLASRKEELSVLLQEVFSADAVDSRACSVLETLHVHLNEYRNSCKDLDGAMGKVQTAISVADRLADQCYEVAGVLAIAESSMEQAAAAATASQLAAQAAAAQAGPAASPADAAEPSRRMTMAFPRFAETISRRSRNQGPGTINGNGAAAPQAALSPAANAAAATAAAQAAAAQVAAQAAQAAQSAANIAEVNLMGEAERCFAKIKEFVNEAVRLAPNVKRPPDILLELGPLLPPSQLHRVGSVVGGPGGPGGYQSPPLSPTPTPSDASTIASRRAPSTLYAGAGMNRSPSRSSTSRMSSAASFSASSFSSASTAVAPQPYSYHNAYGGNHPPSVNGPPPSIAYSLSSPSATPNAPNSFLHPLSNDKSQQRSRSPSPSRGPPPVPAKDGPGSPAVTPASPQYYPNYPTTTAAAPPIPNPYLPPHMQQHPGAPQFAYQPYQPYPTVSPELLARHLREQVRPFLKDTEDFLERSLRFSQQAASELDIRVALERDMILCRRVEAMDGALREFYMKRMGLLELLGDPEAQPMQGTNRRMGGFLTPDACLPGLHVGLLTGVELCPSLPHTAHNRKLLQWNGSEPEEEEDPASAAPPDGGPAGYGAGAGPSVGFAGGHSGNGAGNPGSYGGVGGNQAATATPMDTDLRKPGLIAPPPAFASPSPKHSPVFLPPAPAPDRMASSSEGTVEGHHHDDMGMEMGGPGLMHDKEAAAAAAGASKLAVESSGARLGTVVSQVTGGQMWQA